MISDRLLFEVAVSYYIKKKLQREIAAEYGVSHVQVSKYLKLVAERGIVEITINPPWVTATSQEKYSSLFKEMFQLKHLVLTPGNTNTDKSHPMLIEYAGKWIEQHIPNEMTNIGIGWGRTIYDLSMYRGSSAQKDMWTYLPLTVSLTERNDQYFDYTKIIHNFSKHYGGHANPALMEMLQYDDKALHPMIARYWEQIDVMICGIGHAFTRYPGIRDQAFSEEVVDAARSKELVGDYINYYFDMNGNIYSMTQPRLTIPLDIIKRVPQRMAIAGGYQKVESIIGCLKTGLIDILMTDEITAQNIINIMK